MTPLAHAIALEMTKPVKDRRIEDAAGLAHRITDFVCFECTEIIPMVTDLCREGVTPSDRSAFLPAPLTFIDMKVSQVMGAKRAGYLLAERAIGEDADVFFVTGVAEVGFNFLHLGHLPLRGRTPIAERSFGEARHARDMGISLGGGVGQAHMPGIYALLAIINSPRVIGRRQHMPHAGLQRKIAAAKGMVGKFPLRAWTEIVLQVTPPVTEDGVHEARLSAGKALHFVRQHIRVIGGVLVRIGGQKKRLGGREILIPPHFRGDPSLGMKKSRYRLAP